jgi:hypothetical protein
LVRRRIRACHVHHLVDGTATMHSSPPLKPCPLKPATLDSSVPLPPPPLALLPSRSTRQQLEAQASALTMLLRFILQAVQLTTYSSPSTPKSRLPRALSRRMCTSSPFTRRDSFPPGELPLLFPSSPSRLCCTCRLTLTRSSSPCFRG